MSLEPIEIKTQFAYFNELEEVCRLAEKQVHLARVQKLSQKNNPKMSTALGKKVDFEEFDGSVTSNPASFLSRTERVFKLKNITLDEIKCNTFAVLMKESTAAQHWFDQLLVNGPKTKAEAKNNEEVNEITVETNWELLKAEFSKKWIQDHDEKLKAKLTHLVMNDTQTVEEFALELNSIAHQIRNPPYTDRELQHQFVMKLRPDIRNPVRLQVPKSFANAYEIALLVESNQTMYEMENSSGGPRSRRNVRGNINAISTTTNESGTDSLEQRLAAVIRKEIEPINTRLDKLEKDFTGFKTFASRNFVRRNNSGASYYNSAPSGPRKCYNCNATGHFSNACPQPRKNPTNPNSQAIRPGANRPAAKINAVEEDEGDYEEYPIDEYDSQYYPSELEEDESNVNPIIVVEEVQTINSATTIASDKSKDSPLSTTVRSTGIDIKLIVDTGAAQSVISANTLKKLPEKIQKLVKPIESGESNLRSATGNILKKVGNIELDIQFPNVLVKKLPFIVIENLNNQAILGVNVLKELFGSIDANKGTIEYIGKDKSKTPTIIQLKPPIKKDLLVGSVYLSKKYTIPARADAYITDTKIKGLGHFNDTTIATMKKKSNYTNLIFVIEADGKTPLTLNKSLQLLPSVAVATDEVLEAKQGIPIRIVNKSKQPIVLQANTRIGRVEAVKQSQIKPLESQH